MQVNLVGILIDSLGTLYRHGDRTPIYTYKDDPNVNKWDLPAGALTTIGMEQQFLQGQRLKKRYVGQLNFINGSYNPRELYARSADTSRCIQSAGANLAALYSGSVVHPNTPGWPSNWMPYPIHTYPSDSDTLCEEGSSSCQRIGLLESRRQRETPYVQYLIKNQDFLNQLTQWSGGTVNDAGSINRLWDTLYCQRAHNMTMPSWATNDVWNQLNEMFIYTDDYKDGLAVQQIGPNDNKELLSLRSGELLKQFISSMSDVHDSTIKALMRIYHNVKSVLGTNNPGYASHLVHELWKDTKGNYYIQVLFSDNAYTEYRQITSTLDGCSSFPNGCPFNNFTTYYSSYIQADFWKQCALTS
ncbi:unnamed protein product, partial [Mesorhabditis belari]|uniref:Uncharacterized protein n=1 Tax=Mesorhabditis belari TaxID=2138241 RepID=A0AAF3FNY0_9BILA